MAKIHVTTTINGEPVEFLCEPQQTMLDVLRDELRLTGSKEGCATGDCGACSVTVGDRLVCSCLMLGAEAEGQEIETIEGMADGDTLHPMQEAFREHHALQCGFCTPGMVMSAIGIVNDNPDLDEKTIRHQLEGNICRCTGYHNIVEAIGAAAEDMKG